MHGVILGPHNPRDLAREANYHWRRDLRADDRPDVNGEAYADLLDFLILDLAERGQDEDTLAAFKKLSSIARVGRGNEAREGAVVALARLAAPEPETTWRRYDVEYTIHYSHRQRTRVCHHGAGQATGDELKDMIREHHSADRYPLDALVSIASTREVATSYGTPIKELIRRVQQARTRAELEAVGLSDEVQAMFSPYHPREAEGYAMVGILQARWHQIRRYTR